MNEYKFDSTLIVSEKQSWFIDQSQCPLGKHNIRHQMMRFLAYEINFLQDSFIFQHFKLYLTNQGCKITGDFLGIYLPTNVPNILSQEQP